MIKTEYTKCVHCPLFVERNDEADAGIGIAEFVHLHRGDAADSALDASHEARPSGESRALTWWRRHGPTEVRARFID